MQSLQRHHDQGSNRRLNRGDPRFDGLNEANRDIYPGTLAPIVRVGADGQREVVPATWGMPSPPAYIANYDPGVRATDVLSGYQAVVPLPEEAP